MGHVVHGAVASAPHAPALCALELCFGLCNISLGSSGSCTAGTGVRLDLLVLFLNSELLQTPSEVPEDIHLLWAEFIASGSSAGPRVAQCTRWRVVGLSLSECKSL